MLPKSSHNKQTVINNNYITNNFCIFYFCLDVSIDLKEIYINSYPQLISSLPMKDAIFRAHLMKLKLLPDNLKGMVESKPTEADAASCFLDNMIKPAVETGNNEPFEILLSQLEKSENIHLKKLAQDIRKEIHKAASQEPLTGKI